ncbi:MAG: hypothetical protein FJ088_00565 [Deltaproteobacteria bacterium]|nr:hypothetical protein [Deltaproteobacteria bacterium]
MAKIIFLDGAEGIGGNKFLIEDGEARVLFDFGSNFTREQDYFEYDLVSCVRNHFTFD